MYLSLSLMGTTLSTVPSPVVSSAIESGVVSIVVSSSWPGVRREKQRVRIERAYEEVGEWLWGEVGGVRWVGWVSAVRAPFEYIPGVNTGPNYRQTALQNLR